MGQTGPGPSERTQSDAAGRARRRAVVVTFVVPLLLSVVTFLVLRSWVPELPNPVATHWGPSGEADGFTDASVVPWLAFLGAAIGVLSGGVVLALGHRTGAMRRTAAGLSVGTAVLIAAVVLGTVGEQRGLVDARSVTDSLTWLPIGLLAGLVAGALAAWAAGGDPPGVTRAVEPIPPSAPRADLRSGPQAWSGSVQPGTPVLVITAVLVAAGLVCGGVGLAGAMPGAVAATLALSLGIVGLVTAAMSVFRVTADADGLTVRAAVGWPRFHVALDEIAEASAADVSPLGEFGGWGVRMGLDGRMGVVVRSGEAVQVRRGDGTSLVVTVDGAHTAAALLNSLADRSRGRRLGPGEEA